jgi:hypothetical protein
MAQTSAPAKLAHLASSEDILKECDKIDQDLEHLRATYEQYFLGIERLAPVRMHERLKRRLQNVKSTYNRSTSVQFRVQSLSNKYLTYQRLWERTIREIEAGTYKRDLFKARLHAKGRSAERSPTPTAPEPPAAVAAAPVTGQSPQRAQPQTPSAAPGDLSEAKLRAVYDAYVDAKKRCREDVSKISFESVASKLRKQVPTLMEKHQVNSVEFKVVIKNGKALLRAVPKGAARNGDEP